MRYKKIIYILLFWFVFYGLVEIIMNSLFNENIPFWKTISISLITAIYPSYVIFKKNKNLVLKDLLTYQEREVLILKDIDVEFNSRLSQRLKENGYLLLDISQKNEIKFKSKTTLKNFGEIYKILVLIDKIRITSKPKLFTNFVCEDAIVTEKMNEIENIVNKNYR